MYKLVGKYTLFALISAAVNFLTQEFFSQIYTGTLSFYVSVFFGTLFGLLVKYILDKMYIFKYQHKSHADNIFKFILYTGMGVVTTFIFWVTEWSFYKIFTFEYAKYIGGGIGLTVGYIVKYFLDKSFVFGEKSKFFHLIVDKFLSIIRNNNTQLDKIE